MYLTTTKDQKNLPRYFSQVFEMANDMNSGRSRRDQCFTFRRVYLFDLGALDLQSIFDKVDWRHERPISLLKSDDREAERPQTRPLWRMIVMRFELYFHFKLPDKSEVQKPPAPPC